MSQAVQQLSLSLKVSQNLVVRRDTGSSHQLGCLDGDRGDVTGRRKLFTDCEIDAAELTLAQQSQ